VSKANEAPGRLELIRAFVNTRDIEESREELATPRAVHEWMVSRGLLDPDEGAGEADLRRALDVREALRALLHANNGAPPNAAAAALLDDVARHARVMARFAADGIPRLEPAAPGMYGAFGRLLAVVHDAVSDGTWARLKACRNDECQWAFYDRAKNRSGAWCEMGLCGNRMKARAYRQRHGHGGEAPAEESV
jgi:predicted RNA-binding Zn ribbon-like protein